MLNGGPWVIARAVGARAGQLQRAMADEWRVTPFERELYRERLAARVRWDDDDGWKPHPDAEASIQGAAPGGSGRSGSIPLPPPQRGLEIEGG